MDKLIELTADEKINTGGGFFLGPIIFDLTGFVRDVMNGFSQGLSDSIKK